MIPCVDEVDGDDLSVKLRWMFPGVEDMLSLEELDVSENLISSHRCLLPVRALYRLDKVSIHMSTDLFTHAVWAYFVRLHFQHTKIQKFKKE